MFIAVVTYKFDAVMPLSNMVKYLCENFGCEVLM